VGTEVTGRRVAFLTDPRRKQWAEFGEICQTIETLAPDIAANVMSSRSTPAAMLARLMLPRGALSIEMAKVRRVAPRGTRLRHANVPKTEQLRRMAEAGIPVPRWTLIEPGTKLDPAHWGRYVVVKPSTAGRGAFVRIFLTVRVAFRARPSFPAGHPGRKAPMLAQEFIYTGTLPISYRVLTYLGHPVLALRYDGKEQNRLASRFGFREAGGQNIVAPAKGCTISLHRDEEMLDLARRVHGLWPDHPALGIDFVRDAESGRLYVLETNPRGDSWLLSGPDGLAIQREFGLDFDSQFGAREAIAAATIERLRRSEHLERR
jgi:hypothetical protein